MSDGSIMQLEQIYQLIAAVLIEVHHKLGAMFDKLDAHDAEFVKIQTVQMMQQGNGKRRGLWETLLGVLA